MSSGSEALCVKGKVQKTNYGSRCTFYVKGKVEKKNTEPAPGVLSVLKLVGSGCTFSVKKVTKNPEALIQDYCLLKSKKCRGSEVLSMLKEKSKK